MEPTDRERREREMCPDCKGIRRVPLVLLFHDDHDGSIFVEVEGWKGCISDGKDEQDAIRMICDAMAAWTGDCYERKLPIPLPDRAAAERGERERKLDAERIEALTMLVDGLEGLNTCYRLGRQPNESTWRKVEQGRGGLGRLNRIAKEAP